MAADAPLTFDEIRQQQIELRKAVIANQPPYDDMSKRDRDLLASRQGQLLSLIEGKDTLLDLDEADRTAAINSLEWIRAEVNDAEENRLVCRREKRTGSHMQSRVCKTVAERRKEREDAQQAWAKGTPCSKGIGCQ